MISASSVFFSASAVTQVDLRSLLIRTVWLWSIILYFLSYLIASTVIVIYQLYWLFSALSKCYSHQSCQLIFQLV